MTHALQPDDLLLADRQVCSAVQRGLPAECPGFGTACLVLVVIEDSIQGLGLIKRLLKTASVPSAAVSLI